MAGFIELLEADPQFRLAFVYVAGVLLSIPAGLIHKLLDEAPDWAIRPVLTTTLFTPLVILLGYGLAHLLGLPGEYGGYIGAIAGERREETKKRSGRNEKSNCESG